MTPSTTAVDKGGGSANTFMLKYCRMCALELKQGVFIFGEEGKRLQIPEKIRKTVSILVLEEDSLPKKICTDCCSSLEDYSQYKDTVLDAQEKLASIVRNLERSQEQSMLQIQAEQQNQLKIQGKSKSQSRKPIARVPSPRCETPELPPTEDSMDDRDDPMTLDDSNEDIVGSLISSPADRDKIFSNSTNLEAARNAETVVEADDSENVEENQRRILQSSDVTVSSKSDKQSQEKDVEEQDEEYEDDQSLQCGICGKPIEGRAELDYHHKNVHDLLKHRLPVYGCSLCSRVSENYNAIRIHIYRHKNEGKFKCSECENMFPVKDQLDRHMLAVHNGGLKAFPCKICGKRFSAKCSLVVHMSSKHPKENESEAGPIVSSISSESQSNTGICAHSPNKIDRNEVGLSRPGLPKDLSEKERPSEYLNLQISSIADEKLVHNSKPSSSDRKKLDKNDGKPDGIWRCEYCDKIHQTLSGYQAHIATHKGRRFPCEHCTAVFTQKASLSHHMTTQHSQVVREFRCTVCNKEFKTSKHMKMHMQFHGEPDSKETCPICQKVYKSKAHLKSHMKTHKSQKNFTCSVCQKAFATQSKLNDHKNSHTGARPYKCNYCEYTASHVGQFYKHKNSHRKEILCESKSASNDRIQDSDSHTSTLGASNTSTTALDVSDVSTDLSTKSPQKIHQTHSSLSHSYPSSSSSVNGTSQSSQTNINSQQMSSSFGPQSQPGTHSQVSQAMIASSNTEPIHSSSQTYSQPQQLWSSSNASIQSGRAYQNQTTEGVASSGGTNGVDLVNCAIQHTLTSEDLSSNSHSTSQVLNYSPNNQAQSSHISHTNHNNNNVSLPSFVSTSSPITSNGNISNNNTSVSIADVSGPHSQPHQSEPMELSYKLQIESSEFQDMPMELTKVFQRDPLELCVRQDFNPLMDLSSRVVNVTDPNGMSMNSMSMNMNLSNNGMGSGMNGMGMGYHKLDITERELSFNDLSGAFRQPIDLIARTDETSHELCSEGNLVDLSLRSSFVQDQSASSFLRELIDLSARSESYNGELNLTNKHHHQQASHAHMHQAGGNTNHHGSTAGGINKHTGGNGNHHHHHHGNGAGTLQHVIYQDAMFSLQN